MAYGCGCLQLKLFEEGPWRFPTQVVGGNGQRWSHVLEMVVLKQEIPAAFAGSYLMTKVDTNEIRASIHKYIMCIDV